jgi:hypothetical protein
LHTIVTLAIFLPLFTRVGDGNPDGNPETGTRGLNPMKEEEVQDIEEQQVAAIRAQLRALLTFLSINRRKTRSKMMLATVRALKEFIFIP